MCATKEGTEEEETARTKRASKIEREEEGKIGDGRRQLQYNEKMRKPGPFPSSSFSPLNWKVGPFLLARVTWFSMLLFVLVGQRIRRAELYGKRERNHIVDELAGLRRFMELSYNFCFRKWGWD